MSDEHATLTQAWQGQPDDPEVGGGAAVRGHQLRPVRDADGTAPRLRGTAGEPELAVRLERDMTELDAEDTPTGVGADQNYGRATGGCTGSPTLPTPLLPTSVT